MKLTQFFTFSLILLLTFSGCSTIDSLKNPKSEDEITSTPHNKGSIVISMDKNSFLVVDTSPPNKQAGRYSAINYRYSNPSRIMKIGQRVEVESTGDIAESYPGIGTAKNVAILPDYKPEGAILSESEVLRKAIKIAEKKGKFAPGFHYINFDKKNKEWNLGILQDEKTYELKIEDKQ